jgi:pre-mRNA-splicing factor ATP-dependent RNA helicase DHX15/PRP43
MLTVPNGDHLTLVNVYNSYMRTGAYYEVALLSAEDERKRSINNRRALCCGFFMQVAHKKGDKCNYVMVKDNRDGGARSLVYTCLAVWINSQNGSSSTNSC